MAEYLLKRKMKPINKSRVNLNQNGGQSCKTSTSKHHRNSFGPQSAFSTLSSKKLIKTKETQKSAEQFNQLRTQELKYAFQNIQSQIFLRNGHSLIQQLLDEKERQTVFNLLDLLGSSGNKLWPTSGKEKSSVHLLRLFKWLCNDSQSICLIRNITESHLLAATNQQALRSDDFMLLPLGREHADLVLNWGSFMERIMENQRKYPSSQGKMSQLSKIIVYLYSVYTKNSTQISNIVRHLEQDRRLSDEPLELGSSDPEQDYTVELIRKNIRQAWEVPKMDYHNYFKKKQHAQRNLKLEYREVHTQAQFHDFLNRRIGRKGKSTKYVLFTGCSACFNDRFQTYNPLLSCPNCFLRCHKKCFDLNNNECHNCSYQRLRKDQKKDLLNCIVCKQTSQMVSHFGNNLYAHNFCLLMHQHWQVTKSNTLQMVAQQTLRPKHNGNTEYTVRYVEPQRQEPSHSNKDSGKEQCPLDRETALSSKTVTQEAIIAKQQHCQQCDKAILRNMHLECKHCHKKYHAFCGYFEGFGLKEGTEGGWELDCCTGAADRAQVAYLRKFRLNYKRILFDKKLGEDKMAEDKKEEVYESISKYIDDLEDQNWFQAAKMQ